MWFRSRNTASELRNYAPERAFQRRMPIWAGNICRTPLFKLLQRMETASARTAKLDRREFSHYAWPMAFRRELRQLFDEYDIRWNRGEVDIVRFYMLTCPPSMIPICVWMLSRFSDSMHLYELKTLRHSLSPQRRRHLAKALRRLQAWSLLREMAAENPNDPRIQWFATAATTHRTFPERLRNFTSAIDKSHAPEVKTPSQMSFWAFEQPWQRTPPKSIDLMRRILRHIQHLVHWGVS